MQISAVDHRRGVEFPVSDARIPSGPLSQKWQKLQRSIPLVSPNNRPKYRIIVVGTGLAGSAAAAALGELGYNVESFCIQDSPRRAHSVAAQGGINAAKNYRNDGDSVYRLFYETIKGGDFRAREANVYRLAEISTKIIDHCVALGVPFAREYGGMLANRSFGGVQVSRTFYARGATGQQLLLATYGALCRQIALGKVVVHPRTEILDIVLVDGHAKGVIARDLVSGEISAYSADAVVLATGGYGNIYYLSTNGRGSNATAIWRAFKRGAAFANPCFTQIHPTCIPVSGDYQSKLTLMSESLRNDGRIWVPSRKEDKRAPEIIPESERDYFLERLYPTYGNLVPRDIASRAIKRICDEGRGVGPGGQGVYLDFSDTIKQKGIDYLKERYGNLFDIYRDITGENAYRTPMRIYPAVHYVMGGLWVDYYLMSTIPGLFVLGEANFSDHGANRLGASALMQGLADGFFILPITIGDYLARVEPKKISPDRSEFIAQQKEAVEKNKKLLSIQGKKTVSQFHKELGAILWNRCGMIRNGSGLKEAVSQIIELREQFWKDVKVGVANEGLNQSLEYASRLTDYLELAELMCMDAASREESCGCHFREEYQTPEGEGIRNDKDFAYVSVWFYRGKENTPLLVKEPLVYEETQFAIRSYK
ncbi:succinate dehydrogenase flavoprotein subunit [Methylacidiphilum sp. Yel]|uniref:fumarate reductase/succinate dehydrogenase flavoprotein subunit n=1 Tax=Methylacidiphilum sp. Yel TaxID=1847730 RepID=UPI00106A93FA|nr:fumarate reductase/succinate dehydrogenase flavoprotein subunit [Methylacidiphilum sp. Yel]TFE68696.1 succinate dehydrogenase flavoprotein subunit [Methylacidiphilum sp. Yel]